MKKQWPLNSTLLSSSKTENLNNNEFNESVSKAKRNAMRNRLFQMEEFVENLHKYTISKAEHEAEIAQLKAKYENEIFELHKALKNNEQTYISIFRHLTNTNAELYTRIFAYEKTIQKLKSEAAQQIQPQNATPTLADQENAIFKTFAYSCKIDDIAVDGKIEYEKFNGKTVVILVNDLRQNLWGTWFADGIEISFENNQNFIVYIQNSLTITTNFDIVFNRVFYNYLKILKIYSTEIKYRNFKKLISSPYQIQHVYLDRIIVINEKNGKVYEINQLFKDILEKIPDVEEFTYHLKEGEKTFQTAHKFAEFLPFPNLRKLTLKDIQGGFDLQVFGNFIKKNPKVIYNLRFRGTNLFYSKIKYAEQELCHILPSICELYIDRYRNPLIEV